MHVKRNLPFPLTLALSSKSWETLYFLEMLACRRTDFVVAWANAITPVQVCKACNWAYVP